jgi:hypothetical protein
MVVDVYTSAASHYEGLISTETGTTFSLFQVGSLAPSTIACPVSMANIVAWKDGTLNTLRQAEYTPQSGTFPSSEECADRSTWVGADKIQGTIYNGVAKGSTGSYIWSFTKRSVGGYTAVDATHEASALSAYGVSTRVEVEAFIASSVDADSLVADLAAYHGDLHGELSITVPMRYYSVEVGDNIDVEIWREASSMLGTKKCEVLGKSYDLGRALITFDLRIN